MMIDTNRKCCCLIPDEIQCSLINNLFHYGKFPTNKSCKLVKTHQHMLDNVNSGFSKFFFPVWKHVFLEHIHSIFRTQSIWTFTNNCKFIIDAITLFSSHYFGFNSNNCWSKPSLRSGKAMSSDSS